MMELCLSHDATDRIPARQAKAATNLKSLARRRRGLERRLETGGMSATVLTHSPPNGVGGAYGCFRCLVPHDL